MVRNAVHNALLNTLTMNTPFPRDPLEKPTAPIGSDFEKQIDILRFQYTTVGQSIVG